jgi:hypothetical protein
MINIVRKIGIMCAFVAMTLHVRAQDMMSLHLNGLYGSTFLHPGLKLEKKINFSLYDRAISGGIKGKSLGEYLTKVGTGKYELTNVGYESKRFDELFLHGDINTVGLSVRVTDFHILAGHNIRAKSAFGFPSDLVELIYRGNGDYIGKTLNIGPDLNVLSFNELYLGFQKNWGKLTIGAKAKALSGIAVAKTISNKLDLTTSNDNYNITIDSDIEIESSGVITVEDTSSQNVDDLIFDFNPFGGSGFFKKNSGFGLDLGASYDISEKLTLSVGITDIGKISWDHNASVYRSNGKFEYKGLDIAEFLENENAEYSLEDSIRSLLNIKRTNSQFSTPIGSNFIFSAVFRPSDKWSFYGLLQSRGSLSLRKNQLVLAASRRISIFDVGLQYAAQSTDSYTNFGVNLIMHVGPIKLYASTDNVVSIFDPINSRYATLRVGLNGRF